MTNPLFKAVDRAPLSGRDIIKDTVKEYIEASSDEEHSRYVSVNKVLGAMTVAHAFQAFLGFTLLGSEVQHYRDYSRPLDLALVGVDAIYGAVNTIIAARQAAIIPRMMRIHAKRSESEATVEHVEPRDESEDTESEGNDKADKAGAVALGVTLLGQAIFVGGGVIDIIENPHHTLFSNIAPSPHTDTGDMLESGKIVITTRI
jgi:hypothetical protein